MSSIKRNDKRVSISAAVRAAANNKGCISELRARYEYANRRVDFKSSGLVGFGNVEICAIPKEDYGVCDLAEAIRRSSEKVKKIPDYDFGGIEFVK